MDHARACTDAWQKNLGMSVQLLHGACQDLPAARIMHDKRQTIEVMYNLGLGASLHQSFSPAPLFDALATELKILFGRPAGDKTLYHCVDPTPDKSICLHTVQWLKFAQGL